MHLRSNLIALLAAGMVAAGGTFGGDLYGASGARGNSAAGWHLLAYGGSSGREVIAEASVPGIPGPPAPNHRSLRFRVMTAPTSLRVDVSWTLDCGSNTLAGGRTYTGSFTKTVLKASGCAGTLDADITTGTGSVRVWIYGR